MIKGAAQSYLLETVLQWPTDELTAAEPSLATETALADFLFSFHSSQKILARGTPLWSKCGDWVKTLVGSDDLDVTINRLVSML